MNILLMRPSPLGNATLTLPLLDCLKRRVPEAKIFILACPLSRAVFEHHPAVTEILNLPKGKIGWRESLVIARTLRQLKIRVAFVLKTGGTMERIAFLAGIPHRVGFKKSLFQLLTHRYNVDPNDHISLQTIQPLRYFTQELSDVTENDLRPKIPLDPSDERRAFELVQALGLQPQHFFTVHPMGATAQKSGLNHAIFTEVIPKIASQTGAKPVFLGAPSERDTLEHMTSATGATLFIEQGSPRQVIQLISQAQFHIGNDSGWSHVAEALGRPKVVFYSDDALNFQRWRPLTEERSLSLINPSRFSGAEIEERITAFLRQLS